MFYAQKYNKNLYNFLDKWFVDKLAERTFRLNESVSSDAAYPASGHKACQGWL